MFPTNRAAGGSRKLSEGDPRTLPAPPTSPQIPIPSPSSPRATHVLPVAEDEVLGRCVKGSARGQELQARDKASGQGLKPWNEAPGPRDKASRPGPRPLGPGPPPTRSPVAPRPQEGYDGLHHHLLHLLALPAGRHGCRRLAAPAAPALPPPEAAEAGRERARDAGMLEDRGGPL